MRFAGGSESLSTCIAVEHSTALIGFQFKQAVLGVILMDSMLWLMNIDR